MAAPLNIEAALLEVKASTGAALMQTLPSHDQIIAGHLRDADAKISAILAKVREHRTLYAGAL